MSQGGQGRGHEHHGHHHGPQRGEHRGHPRGSHGPQGDRVHPAYPSKWHSFKLLVDPLIHVGAPRVLRFNGHIVPGQPHHEPPIVCDPRTKLPSALLRRLEPIELPLPSFKVDENYVGEVPKLEVTVDNLNDNVDKSFLAKMATKHGHVVEIEIYRHPNTNKHLGLARIVFDKVKSARECVAALNNKSVMGNKLECYLDPLATRCKAKFKEVTEEKKIVPTTVNSDNCTNSVNETAVNESQKKELELRLSGGVENTTKRDPRSELKASKDVEAQVTQVQIPPQQREELELGTQEVCNNSCRDGQMSLAARISAIRRSRDQSDTSLLDSSPLVNAIETREQQPAQQKWGETSQKLQEVQAKGTQSPSTPLMKDESLLSKENQKQHVMSGEVPLSQELSSHQSTKTLNPDYSDPDYWLKAAQKYAASASQSQTREKENVLSEREELSSAQYKNEDEEASEDESVASSHHQVDLDTRLKLLMTDHSSAMPAFLLDEFRHSTEDQIKEGHPESDVDEKALSRPPSPFLSYDSYLKCHQQSVKADRRQRRRQQRRQQRLLRRNGCGDPSDGDEDKMSLSSLSDEAPMKQEHDHPHHHQYLSDFHHSYPPPPPGPLMNTMAENGTFVQYNEYGYMQEHGQHLVNGDMGDNVPTSFSEELPRSKEAYKPLIEEIVLWVVRELKATLRKELKKRICETLTFYLFEAWWAQQEKRHKERLQRRPNESRMIGHKKTVLGSHRIAEPPVVHITSNPTTTMETTMKKSDDITSFLEKQRESIEAGVKDRGVGNAFGVGGSLGLGFRGTIPKLPSFKKKSHHVSSESRGRSGTHSRHRRKDDDEKENRRRRDSRHQHRKRREERLREHHSNRKRGDDREKKKSNKDHLHQSNHSSSDEHETMKSRRSKHKDPKSKDSERRSLKLTNKERVTHSNKESLKESNKVQLQEIKEVLPEEAEMEKRASSDGDTNIVSQVTKSSKKKVEKLTRSSSSSSSSSSSASSAEEEEDKLSSVEETQLSSKSSSLSSSSDSESSSLEESSDASSSLEASTLNSVPESREPVPSKEEPSLSRTETKPSVKVVSVHDKVDDVVDVVNVLDDAITVSPSHIIDHCYAKPSEAFPKSRASEEQPILEEQSNDAFALVNDHGYTPEVAMQATKKRPAAPMTPTEQPSAMTTVTTAKPPTTLRHQVPKHQEAKFSPRDRREQFEILYEFLTHGLDLEDMCFLKRSYEQLLNNSLKKHPWLNDTHWVNHPVTISSESRHHNRRHRRREPSPHKSGSCRTEGYYKMDAVEKMRTKYHLQRDDAFVQSHSRSLAEGPNKRQQSAQNLSREARSTQRRQLAVLGEEALNSDLLKFNQLKFRRKQLTFGKSPIHDWGLFALEPVGPDEMIIEYVGQVVRPVVSDGREKRYEKQGIGSSYFFRIDLDYVVDATQCGNLARFINHSCDPNCYAKVITVEGEKKIVIYSKQPIAVGEEITYDYKFPIEDEKIVCLCGSKNCRRYLN